MTYATAFAKGRERPAGIVAMSGFVPGVDGLDIDLSDVGGYPVAIAHGSQDPVISVRFGRDARARFEAAGADVLWRESPMAHTIDPRFVSDLQRWLPRVVPRRRPMSRPSADSSVDLAAVVAAEELALGRVGLRVGRLVVGARRGERGAHDRRHARADRRGAVGVAVADPAARGG